MSPTARSLNLLRKKWPRQKFVKICEICGKEFRPFHKHNRFCSRACGVVGRSGIRKKNPVSVPCHVCGKPVLRSASKTKRYPRGFCGENCLLKWKKKRYSGRNNPNFRNAGNRICEGCGATYRSYDKGRKYCGRSCSGIGSRSLYKLPYGRVAEYQCANALAESGSPIVLIPANSRGPFDVVALGNGRILAIQVKRSISPKWKNCSFYYEPTRKISVNARKLVWLLIDGQGWTVKEVNDDGETLLADRADDATAAEVSK